jgi:hypothetical protein
LVFGFWSLVFGIENHSQIIIFFSILSSVPPLSLWRGGVRLYFPPSGGLRGASVAEKLVIANKKLVNETKFTATPIKV